MKTEEKNIFNGMPSLLQGKKLDFLQDWPINMILPSPFTIQKLKKANTNVTQREHKLITACPHQNRKHYAKNMCKNCYIKIGRDKPAWLCPHKERAHYAKGQCQLCYLSCYNKEKKTTQKD